MHNACLFKTSAIEAGKCSCETQQCKTRHIGSQSARVLRNTRVCNEDPKSLMEALGHDGASNSRLLIQHVFISIINSRRWICGNLDGVLDVDPSLLGTSPPSATSSCRHGSSHRNISATCTDMQQHTCSVPAAYMQHVCSMCALSTSRA